MPVVHRQLADRPREGARQLAAGIHRAEQDVGYRGTGMLTEERGKHERIRLLSNIGEEQWPAGHDDGHHRGARLGEFAYQLLLVAGEPRFRSRLSLTGRVVPDPSRAL